MQRLGLRFNPGFVAIGGSAALLVISLACAGQVSQPTKPSVSVATTIPRTPVDPSVAVATTPRDPADGAPPRIRSLLLLRDDEIFAYHPDGAWSWRPQAGWSRLPPAPAAAHGRTLSVAGAGQILVVGGEEGSLLYHRADSTWTVTQGATRPLLPLDIVSPGGMVLAIGGWRCHEGTPIPGWRFDAHAGTWAPMAGDVPERPDSQAIVVSDGRVLVSGGLDLCEHYVPLSTSSWLDPGTDIWSDGPTLLSARARHGAILLPDGDVLLVGGPGAEPGAERLDLSAGVSHPVEYAGPNTAFAIVRRRDGTWWVIGGRRDPAYDVESDVPLAEVWVFDPETGAFRAGPPLPVAVDHPQAVELSDGRLIIGDLPEGSPAPLVVLPPP